ncbi:carboxylesterase 15-like [Phragmites australis]|uniref:carboxylesterase 15-like n=1 Tax=Phragmites australis TaxID=29695 RepID=UPI002D79B89C|nr:carboxylesterase 15-like [Phragmites australis]
MVASTVASGDAPPHVVEDCRGVLRVLSDGTVVRSAEPLGGTEADVPADPSVEWKDAVYNAAQGLRLRVYKPAADAGKRKLPVVVYFHGGGFCIGSYAWPIFHAACSRLAAGLGAIVLSADYRLAPEHRLPAAIDDACAVLLWLRDEAGADPWLAEVADVSRVFVAGESAGGVLAHHMNVRFSGAPAALHPIRLRGFVMLMPFFTGSEPTPYELSCPDDAFLNRDMSGRYIRLCLPAGATADHPFLNPFAPDAPRLDRLDVGPTLVVVAWDDILRDRNVEYARRMAEMGKPVEVVEFPGQGHAFFSLRPWSEPVGELVRVVQQFMDKACSC